MPSRSYRELAATVLDAEPRLDGSRLVVVDGPAGSGKTTFAECLSQALRGATIVHMDDLYEGWTGLTDALWSRLHNGVLEPLANGQPGRYQRYEWAAGRFAEWQEVKPAPVVIVEGVGAAHRAVDQWVTLRVWVDAPEKLRLDRGLRRDGAALRGHWLRWLAHEAEHFAADGTRSRADLLVDGRGTDCDDERGEPSYAVLGDGRR